MHRISPALGYAALGVLAAALIALAISSDLFGALALGSVAPARPLLVEQGSDVSQVPTKDPSDEATVSAPYTSPVRARRPNRVARAKRPLPPPNPPEASVAALPPLPAPSIGVAAMVRP
jgi:hypothetical protein